LGRVLAKFGTAAPGMCRGSVTRVPAMPDALPHPEPYTMRTDPAALDDLRTRLRATQPKVD